ncbi:MAG: RDD family protein [Steroidobacteraceae bacterium]
MSVVQEDGGAQRSAGVWRRFGAMLYDSLLVIALMMLLTAAFLPLTGGEAIMWSRFPAVALTYNAVRVLLVFGFFGWFWTRRGQTLGMAAWRMRIEREDGRLPGWGDAVKRFAGAAVSLAALGLGYFWIWVDRDRLAWHDRWSRTRVIVLPKKVSG